MALFLLALLLFSPPILSMFADSRLLGIPLTYLYLFVAWGLVIALLAIAAERRSRTVDSRRSTIAHESPAEDRED